MVSIEKDKYFFLCDCGIEGIMIDATEESTDEYGIYFGKMEIIRGSYSWGSRIKMIWNMIRGKPLWVSEILLSRESAREMGNLLIEVTK